MTHCRKIIISGLICLFCLHYTAHAQKTNLKNGIWLGLIQRSDSNTIHFNFVAETKKGKTILNIINADDRLLVDDIQQKADSFFITLPFFSSGIAAKIISENKLQGVYIKKYGDKKQEIPFTALFGIKERFPVYAKPKYSITGTWDVLIAGRKNNATKAVGNFTQTPDGKVTGSFLTPTGDYRFLEGVISADTLKLSGFDGGFASLFTAVIKNDSTIETADFYSGSIAHA